tara:strand:- start:4124 stop:4597 length:474 start_codon:yes stop_codon:yes gene_type:complete
MSILQSYPKGTPKKGDYIIGTSIPPANSDEMPITRNFTVDAVAAIANSTAAYTAYAARLQASSAAGGSTPTVVLLANNTGLTFAWARSGVGQYDTTITGGIAPENKVWFTAGSGGGNDYQKLEYGTQTELTLHNYDGTTGVAAEGLNEVYIEIRIYS